MISAVPLLQFFFNFPHSCTAVASESESQVDLTGSVLCSTGWDPVRDPILMVLGTLTGLLCLLCALLITKILHLKKRPR